jgi:FtsZ-binding cell division protein ZapB
LYTANEKDIAVLHKHEKEMRGRILQLEKRVHEDTEAFNILDEEVQELKDEFEKSKEASKGVREKYEQRLKEAESKNEDWRRDCVLRAEACREARKAALSTGEVTAERKDGSSGSWEDLMFRE